jgi:hypothetical protein
LRANQDSGENLSHDARLSEALEDFRQKFGRREDQEHGERNLGRRMHETIMDAESNRSLMVAARIGVAMR